MSEDVGMINVSHFAKIDVQGPDAADLLEYICVAKVGGDAPVGKGVYTHFMEATGGVRADLTVLRLGATLCTLTMTSNIDSTGVARYPVGTCPVMDPATGATLVDELGRRSWTSSIAFGPSIGKNIALAYLPHAYCQVGRELQIQYFADVYPVKVEAVGYQSLYDPENGKPRS